MRNTGIIYSSTDKTPVVLPELAGLLPPLTGEQLSALEADILQNGCYSPVIVNEDLVIVDGHNRQSLCEKHGIPYQMLVFHFDNMLEAMGCGYSEGPPQSDCMGTWKNCSETEAGS